MSTLSVRVPAGFSVVLGNLSEFENESLRGASATEISSLHKGEDLAAFEHLVLDGLVCIDARTDTFVVSVLGGAEGKLVLEHQLETFGAAVQDLEEVLRGVWKLGLAIRGPDTAFTRDTDRPMASAWVVPGGWTVLVDHVSTAAGPIVRDETEPMQLLFAAASGHRSIAVYQTANAGAQPYVGLLWAEPVGRLYERVFFEDLQGVTGWLDQRLRQTTLPKRRKER